MVLNSFICYPRPEFSAFCGSQRKHGDVPRKAAGGRLMAEMSSCGYASYGESVWVESQPSRVLASPFQVHRHADRFQYIENFSGHGGQMYFKEAIGSLALWLERSIKAEDGNMNHGSVTYLST